MAFPRRLQARVGIRAPGHDGCSRRRGLQLPAAAGPRDPLGLLNDVRDLMDQDVQPALAGTAPRGRHEHAVPPRPPPGSHARAGRQRSAARHEA